MKNVIRADLRISLLITFVWTIMSPYTTVLKGLLTVETISLFMVAGSISMEALAILNKNSTFKTSTLHMIVYDLIYLVSIIIGFIFLDDRNFILLSMVMMIPYWPLVRNSGNKFKGLMGEYYPRYFVEHVSTKISILETRIAILSMATSGIIASMYEAKYVVVIFIIASSIQSGWSIYSYRKHYHVFKK